MSIKKTLILTLSSAALLQGCTMTALEMKNRSMEFIFGKNVNMTEKSYAAADYLVQQAGNQLNTDQLTRVYALNNLDAPQLSSKLALSIPEQVGQRLVQLGYSMDISQVVHHADTSFSQAPEQDQTADNALGGTYSQDEQGIHVNLRMTKIQTGKVFATFSYLVPLNRETRKLAEPEAKIMSIDSSWGDE